MKTMICRKCGKTFFGHYNNYDAYCPACMEKSYERPAPVQGGMELLLEVQGKRCAICGRDDIDLVVDHDHRTGLIRGLLCSGCNAGIGFFKDNPEWLESAANYLRDLPFIQQYAILYAKLPAKHRRLLRTRKDKI